RVVLFERLRHQTVIDWQIPSEDVGERGIADERMPEDVAVSTLVLGDDGFAREDVQMIRERDDVESGDSRQQRCGEFVTDDRGHRRDALRVAEAIELRGEEIAHTIRQAEYG